MATATAGAAGSALAHALRVDVRQARRLATHEDARFAHAHKALGAAALAHFAYRLALWAREGSVGLAGAAPAPFLALLALHAALHVSSFEFVLPRRRNRAYNIIWPEMRWHSMAFAYRSLAVTLVAWLRQRGALAAAWEGPCRAAAVFATMAAADAATRLLGDGSTSMRGNPFPDYVPPAARRAVNLFYSVSQLFATLQMLFCGPDLVFLTLVAIQTAPFLMTLEKKGIITQGGWHLGYTAALLVSYAYAHWGPGKAEPSTVPLMLAAAALRFGLRANKYAVWAAVAAVRLARDAGALPPAAEALLLPPRH